MQILSLHMPHRCFALLTAIAVASLAALGQAAPSDESASKPPANLSPVNGYGEQLKAKAKPNSSGIVVNQPYAPVKKPSDDGQIPEIEMFVGESRVFPAPGVGRIAVGNGGILTAAALDGKEIILFANGAGTSSLFIWNDDGRYQRVKINIVPGDTSRIAREIAAFLSAIPKAKASIIGDKVIIEGDELSNQDLARIELLAARYPQIINFTNPMGFEQMIMIDVKVVEFPVNKLRELGLKWSSTGGAAIGGIWSPISRGSSGPFQINQQSGQNNAASIVGQNGEPLVLPKALNVLSVVNMGLNATLDALAQEGSTTVLAEPQLSARNGATAKFLAGGEIPYAISTINGPTVQYKPYGVKLDITPTTDRSGNIRAKIDTEFSQIDSSIASSGGPALLTRRTNTEFNVRNGETIVLSGLIQRENSTSVDKVPGLGELPIIGALFRSKRFQNKETELVIFVSPVLIDSKSPGVVDRIQKTNERLSERLAATPHITDPLQPGADFAKLNSVPPAADSLSTDHKLTPNTQVAGRTIEPAIASSLPAQRASPIGSSELKPASFERPQGSTLRVTKDGLVIYASPNAASEALLQLGVHSVVTLRGNDTHRDVQGSWVPVQVGEMQGWVTQSGVEPSKLQESVRPYMVMSKPQSAGDASNPSKQIAPNVSDKLTLGGLGIQGGYSVLLSKLALRITPDINSPIIQLLQLGQIVQGLALPTKGAWTAIEADGQRGWVATQWLQPMSSKQ